MGKARAKNRIAPVARGKGQARAVGRRAPQGRVDGQPEVLLRVDIGPARLSGQRAEAKQPEQAFGHMEEQGPARVVDRDEQLLVAPALAQQGRAADGVIRLPGFKARQRFPGNGRHIAQQGRITAQVEAQRVIRRQPLSQQAFQQAVRKINVPDGIGPEGPVAREQQVGQDDGLTPGAEPRQQPPGGEFAPARRKPLVQKQAAGVQVRICHGIARVVAEQADAEQTGKGRRVLQKRQQGFALTVGVKDAQGSGHAPSPRGAGRSGAPASALLPLGRAGVWPGGQADGALARLF